MHTFEKQAHFQVHITKSKKHILFYKIVCSNLKNNEQILLHHKVYYFHSNSTIVNEYAYGAEAKKRYNNA